MSDNYYKLKRLFVKSSIKFTSENLCLFKDNVNERTLCGTLSQYINREISSSEFNKYYTDVEYNRNNGLIKTIIDNDHKVVSINCDLIVHSRGEIIQQDNLLALEMKKHSRPNSEKNKDRNRLIALTKKSFNDVWSNDGTTLPEHVCGYGIGIFYEVNNDKLQLNIEYYSEGRFIEKYNIKLRG